MKPEGIFVKNEISVANWFLNGKDDVRSRYMLEDVVSEFFIRLWNLADTYRSGKGHRAWLAAIARNMAIDLLWKH